MIMIDRAEIEAQGKKLIPFPDVTKNYQPMFWLEDSKYLEVTLNDGEKLARPCTYLGTHHFNFGNICYHIDQFAEVNHANGNTCRPMEQVTDLSMFRKLYADRELEGENGKLIPYRAILGWDSDGVGHARMQLAICPEAQPDRQVVFYKLESGKKEFYSIPDAWSNLLPQLPMTKHELDLISAVFEENNRQVEHISQKEWDAIPSDYKGVYKNFDDHHPDWEGRKTAFLPSHGTKLFIEGVSFVIDKGKTLDQIISGASQRKGAAIQKTGQEHAPER